MRGPGTFRSTTLLAVSSLIALLATPARPAPQRLAPTEVLHIPAGTDPATQVRYDLEPGCRYGPQSFRVDPRDGSVAVLDPLNRAIKIYRNGSLVRTLASPPSGRDFLLRSETEYVCLAGNRLLQFRDGVPAGPLTGGAARPLIRRINLTGDRLTTVRHDGTASPPMLLHPLAGAGPARLDDGPNYTAWKRSSRLAEVVVRDGSGVERTWLALPVPGANLGCIDVIGADAVGRLFLDVDLVEQVAPLRVRREVWVVTRPAGIQGRIAIPAHYYSLMFRDMELAADGHLYQMVSSEDGIHILRWRVPGPGVPFEGTSLPPYDALVHYNFIQTPEPRPPDLSPAGSAQLVTRSEADSIGNSYVEHVWTCSPQNISNGVVVDPDGDLVLTPDWIQVGSNQQVPYKWGGTDLLTTFDAGIAAGNYAGDIHSDGSSRFARGVDCSGFVCRCWKTSMTYTTEMMDDPAYGPPTLPYTSWDDLQVGDAVHRHGHVRMVVETLPGGQLLVVESAGSNTGWRVGYYAYSLSELTDFSPRYYIQMEGAPARSTIASARSGSWTTGSTWVGGVVPDMNHHVVIQSGHTVSVDNHNAVCLNLSFAANDALIDMNSNSTLTVYGDMTLASPSHVAFSAGWSTVNAAIKFAGPAVQTLSGWSTSGGSTSLRDVIIDKNGGKVVTDGSEMRLGIQNSLRIVNGTLELAEGDDIEGRWASSGSFTNSALPVVTIQSGGTLTMVDGAGAHHIRSGVGVAIGKFTVQGEAQFRDGSTYGLNLGGMDVESGGRLVVSTGMGDGQFNCGTVWVKAGGGVTNYTTVDAWAPTALLQLDAGALFESKTSTTYFPDAFINNGTVRYSRDAGTDQTVVDMDYHDLEISEDAATIKLWALGGNRVVSGALTVSNGANLLISAGTLRTLTVGTSLQVTGGVINNSDPDVSLTLSSGATIRRGSGSLTAVPAFAGTVNVDYISTLSAVTTGPELPTGAGVLANLTVSGDQGVTLGAPVTVNGVCTLTGSDLATGPHTLTLAPSATLVEAAGMTVVGRVSATRTVATGVAQTFGGIGLDLTATGTAPGVTTVLRVTGTPKQMAESEGITRFFDITPAVNNGLNTVAVFHYDESELNAISEVSLAMYSFTHGGLVAEKLNGTVNAPANTVTRTGLTHFETLTLGPATLSDAGPGVRPVTGLFAAYPNPFRSATTIAFELTGATRVSVEVFDVAGRKVRTLREGMLAPGPYTIAWNGESDGGRPAAPGVYFCRLIAGDAVRNIRLSLME